MTDHVDNTHQLAGLAFAVIASTLPEWLLTTGEKLLLAVVTAFFTGVAYKLGQIAVNRLRGDQ